MRTGATCSFFSKVLPGCIVGACVVVNRFMSSGHRAKRVRTLSTHCIGRESGRPYVKEFLLAAILPNWMAGSTLRLWQEFSNHPARERRYQNSQDLPLVCTSKFLPSFLSLMFLFRWSVCIL
jgi:hypothetical protein